MLPYIALRAATYDLRMAAVYRRSGAVVLCCAAVLAVLAGCGAQPEPAAPGEGIQRMLDRHAAAVLHHDEAAFLADVDPGFRDRQRTVFRNLADVPLASWSYKLLRSGTGARVQARVRLSYRLTGYDRTPVTSDTDLTLSGRDGRWYVAGEGSGARELWDQGRVRAVRGAHSLVLGLAAPDALRSYADAAEHAVPAVRRAWGGGWNGPVVVEVPSSLDGMAALLNAAPAAYRGIAAVTTGELGGAAVAPADRVIVNPEAFGQLSEAGRQVVVTHETTHVATRAATTAATPLWLSEGFADWVGYGGTGPAVRTPRQAAAELARDVTAGNLPERLPTAADFATTSGGLPQAYEGAWLACRLVAQDWGVEKLIELYRATGRGPDAATEAAMRRVLGIGLDAFTARWRAYMQRELG